MFTQPIGHAVNPVVAHTHTPPAHICPLPQAWPHVPQFPGSEAVLTQVSPGQRVPPDGQTHAPPEHTSTDGHDRPQAPQLPGSFIRSVQKPLHIRMLPPPHVGPASTRPESAGGTSEAMGTSTSAGASVTGTSIVTGASAVIGESMPIGTSAPTPESVATGTSGATGTSVTGGASANCSVSVPVVVALSAEGGGAGVEHAPTSPPNPKTAHSMNTGRTFRIVSLPSRLARRTPAPPSARRPCAFDVRRLISS